MKSARVADTIERMSSDPVEIRDLKLHIHKHEGEFIAVLYADPMLGNMKRDWSKPVKLLKGAKQPTVEEAAAYLCDRLTLNP